MKMKKEHKELAEEIEEETVLSEREAEAYVLKKEVEKSHTQVAAILGISEGNAKGKWADIRRKIEQAKDLKEKYKKTAELL